MVCFQHWTRGLLSGCNSSKHARTKSVPVLEFADKYEEANKCVAPYRGQLKVAVYVNAGLLTVHIVAGRHLRSSMNKKLCNAYVKLALTPDESKRTRCKTDIKQNTNVPTFDEKFSFELLQGDYRRRLLISVWNKQSSDRNCELLGCMSFGIRHILQQKKEPINGWYFLLHENIGKRKHLHVREHRLDESSLYMDMRGIDLPGHSSEDSGLDGMDKKAREKKVKEAGTKIHLGSTAVIEAVNEIGRCATPDQYHSSPTLVIKHAPNDELTALKETIEEQKAAIDMLKERLLGGDVIPPAMESTRVTDQHTHMQTKDSNRQMSSSHIPMRDNNLECRDTDMQISNSDNFHIRDRNMQMSNTNMQMSNSNINMSNPNMKTNSNMQMGSPDVQINRANMQMGSPILQMNDSNMQLMDASMDSRITDMQMSNPNVSQMRELILPKREPYVRTTLNAHPRTPIRHLRSPLPIVSNERSQPAKLQEDDSRCPLHDHEPTCPLNGFINHSALLDSSSSEDSSDEDDPPSPTKSPPDVPHAVEGRGGYIQLCLRRGENGGFGFTLTGSRPARVYTVLADSPAHYAGVQPHDIIVTIDNHDVSQLSSDTVARVIRHCGMSMNLTLQRTESGKGAEHTGTGSCFGSQTRLGAEQWEGHGSLGEELKHEHGLGTETGKPMPPQRNSSKTSSLLQNLSERGAVHENKTFLWNLQQGSLESRSRTSEGDSNGQSEGENETENGYLDMRAHWAFMNK